VSAKPRWRARWRTSASGPAATATAWWDAADRLLYAPDGEPAAWIRKVRRQPFSVLLFDEIEKAADEAYDVLLGLLDEGRLTDRFGRVTDFRCAVVVLTSNLGTSATGALGFGSDGVAPAFEDSVRKFFRPEFFNRLDAVAAFDSLSAAEVRRIAIKELRDLAAREGLAGQNLLLEWSDAIVEALVRDGYDPRFGARPLQRALERLVVTPLAKWRLAHPKTRDATLTVDFAADGRVVVRRV
jgi:ATP-dependent Clp protease ATP-binding subunit ClpC